MPRVREIIELPAVGRARAAITTRALDLAGLSARLGRPVVRGEQTHGNEVAVVEARGSSVVTTIPRVDALATRKIGLVVAALGADCPGIAILAPDVSAVAVAHSGWRGSVADVGPRAASRLVEMGARLEDATAWIGPGIGRCCFEVGDEVVRAFEDAHGPLGELVERRVPRPHLDLKGAIARRLIGAGLRRENVHVAPECTKCSDEFHSRRRDGAGCGHHAVVAWIVD